VKGYVVVVVIVVVDISSFIMTAAATASPSSLFNCCITSISCFKKETYMVALFFCLVPGQRAMIAGVGFDGKCRRDSKAVTQTCLTRDPSSAKTLTQINWTVTGQMQSPAALYETIH
jgi:hypothetical protein